MKLSSFILSGALLMGASFSSLSALALPMASPSDRFISETKIEKVYGGCGPYGHRGPWGRCRPGGQWGGGYYGWRARPYAYRPYYAPVYHPLWGYGPAYW